MNLAALVQGTRREYLRAVRQLTAYYMVPSDRLTERQVQDYILYVRDDLGVAQGDGPRRPQSTSSCAQKMGNQPEPKAETSYSG